MPFHSTQCQDRRKGVFCKDVPVVPKLWALIQSHNGTHSMFRGIQLIHCRLQGILSSCSFALKNVLVPSWSACMIIVFYIELYWTSMLAIADAGNESLNPIVPLSKLWLSSATGLQLAYVQLHHSWATLLEQYMLPTDIFCLSELQTVPSQH